MDSSLIVFDRLAHLAGEFLISQDLGKKDTYEQKQGMHKTMIVFDRLAHEIGKSIFDLQEDTYEPKEGLDPSMVAFDRIGLRQAGQL